MKNILRSPHLQARIGLGLVALLAGLGTTHAQLNIPSDGSDGELKITEGMTPLPTNITQVTVTNVVNQITNIVHETVLDLGMAATGPWDANNTANLGMGVYDSNKWAVVFKYSSVTIAKGVRLTFKNHPSRAPVVWLVQSNVVIEGTVDLSGKVNGPGQVELAIPSEPGPGGFRGGAWGPSGQGAGFGISPRQYRSTYGNPEIIPLLGGSGGTAYSQGHGASHSAAGGGAILIAAGQKVTLNGQLLSKPGSGFAPHAAAGGAVKIIAHELDGDGRIDAEPEGRTRIEVMTNGVSKGLQIFPNTANVPPIGTPTIWPPATVPTVRVVSVNAAKVNKDPEARVDTQSDLLIGSNSPVDILMESSNLPIQGTVRLRVAPKYDYWGTVWHTATYVGGDINQATWRVTTTLPPGFTVLQARATAP